MRGAQLWRSTGWSGSKIWSGQIVAGELDLKPDIGMVATSLRGFARFAADDGTAAVATHIRKIGRKWIEAVRFRPAGTTPRHMVSGAIKEVSRTDGATVTASGATAWVDGKRTRNGRFMLVVTDAHVTSPMPFPEWCRDLLDRYRAGIR